MRILITLLSMALISEVAYAKEYHHRSNGSYIQIKVICIEGYKFALTSAGVGNTINATTTQIYAADNMLPPQPLKCK